jgi:dCMP deaminase
MDVARRTADLSHAVRLKVGAVVVKDKNIIAFGYNGMPEHMINDCEIVAADGTLVTRPEVIHAEANAICKLARQGNSGKDAMLFVTHAPCVECAKLIIQTGIDKVYWGQQYRSTSGLDLLHIAGVTVLEVK